MNALSSENTLTFTCNLYGRTIPRSRFVFYKSWNCQKEIRQRGGCRIVAEIVCSALISIGSKIIDTTLHVQSAMAATWLSNINDIQLFE